MINLSETKYTPGPWHTDPRAPEESFFLDVNVLRHDGLAVAVAVQNGDIEPQEAEANARLIAAAPNMLAALQIIVRECEEMEMMLAQEAANHSAQNDERHADKCRYAANEFKDFSERLRIIAKVEA